MRRSVAQIVAVDLFLNAMASCLLYLIMILPFINEPTEPAKAIEAPGNLIVSIAWPEGNYDVDLIVRGPDGKVVMYSNKGSKVWNLLKDDTGTNDDMPFNKEDAYSRGTPDGEYIVNLHGYRLVKKLSVSVEIALATNGATRSLVKTTVSLRHGQERTVARFRVQGGQVVAGSMSNVFVPLRSAGK